MRYYVKAPLSGWHEVTEEKYYEYRELLRNECMPALRGEEKEKRINERTKIVYE